MVPSKWKVFLRKNDLTITLYTYHGRPVRKGAIAPHAESAPNFCEIRGNFGSFQGHFLNEKFKIFALAKGKKLHILPKKISPKGRPLVIFGYIDIVKNNKGGPLVLLLHSVSWPLPRKNVCVRACMDNSLYFFLIF